MFEDVAHQEHIGGPPLSGDVFGRVRGEPVLNGLDAVAEARVGHAEIFAEIEPPGL